MHLSISIASIVTEDGLYTGKIVIKSKNSQFKVTIPYRAHVLSGHLFVNESVTHFHLKDRWGYEEGQLDIQDANSFKSSSDNSVRWLKHTKENEDGDFVHNPIGTYLVTSLKIIYVGAYYNTDHLLLVYVNHI